MYDNRPHGQVGKGYWLPAIVIVLMVLNAWYFSTQATPWAGVAGYVVGAFGGFALALVMLR